MKNVNENAVINAFENLDNGKFKKVLKKNKLKGLRCNLIKGDDGIARVGAGVLLGALRVVIYFDNNKLVLEVADNYKKSIEDIVVLDNFEKLNASDKAKLNRIAESFKNLIDVYVK